MARPPALRVLVVDRQKALRVPVPFLVRVAEAALSTGRWRGGAVELTLVDDPALRELHERFLGDPRKTDVLAFDYRAAGPIGRGPAAELVVSAERALDEARRRGHPPLEELALYVAHGCLHLCGFRDGSAGEARRMRAGERRALRRAGIAHRFFP